MSKIQNPCGVASNSMVDRWTPELTINGANCGRESHSRIQEWSSQTDCCYEHGNAWLNNKGEAKVVKEYVDRVTDDEMAEILASIAAAVR